ncbi:MAG: HNH endonuclease signature motif containing protein [Patescibacteria group bacterium]
MPKNKMKQIERFYDTPFQELVKDFYTAQEMSTREIAEKIFMESAVKITPRHLQKVTKSLGITRSLSEAFLLAITRGRKDYTKLRKPIRASEYRRGISLKIRCNVMKRDNFRCALCGRDSKEATPEVDHIVPVVKKGTNDMDNLRILCRECNRGKKIVEHEK